MVKLTLRMWISCILVALISCYAALSDAEPPSLVVTMICRDEAVNFKANLAKWLGIIDYYVFLVDSRTTDSTEETIKRILEPAGKDYHIRYYNFTGFGPARTLSLQTAWEQFPQASHVLIADPDWRADPETMNIYDLDVPTDVFRFTAFDRNGYTKRQMDWLLRHREGLAMRYNLHEVLDIGMYNMTPIPWVVHEIEKHGSWHTSVGHSDSMSADRYLFDLALLYKDLDIYGHDPHTHYYLGVTHEAYASKAVDQLGLDSPVIQAHLENATRYMELRATTQYDDEFVEQRWAVMFQLGMVHSFMKRDDMKAIYWLSMCRDYKPTQSECSLGLCQLHIKLGQLKPALEEIHSVLQQRKEERAMMEYLNHWECKVPAMAAQIFAKKAMSSDLGADEAMYFFILWWMANHKQCEILTYSLEPGLKHKINAATGNAMVDHFIVEPSFCDNPLLRMYILRNRYTVHSCTAIQHQQQFNLACISFTATAPAAYEEFQLTSLVKTFYGTAIVSDIVHHAFQGYSGAFIARGRTIRFLFAEYFNPEMVFNLLGQLDRQKVQDYEIVVLTDELVQNFISNRVDVCGAVVPPHAKEKLRIINSTILEYFQDNAADHGREGELLRFDYIEYNGGLSKAQDPHGELSALHGLLVEDGGVIGLTYFSRNNHVSRLHKLVDERDKMRMVPFSLEATRLVKSYLDQHKLSFLKEDADIVELLGGERLKRDHVKYKLSDAIPRTRWNVYSQREAMNIINAAGFSVASWVPSAYAHPYDEIEHYAVQRHAASGISQDDFIRTLMPNFRYSVYLVKNQSNSTIRSGVDKSATSLKYHPIGRRKLSQDIFIPLLSNQFSSRQSTLASNIRIVDRVGYLTSSFAGMESIALQQQSLSIEFAHYGFPGDTHFAYILSPIIAPCLGLLSTLPTVQSLHDTNRAFAVRERRPFDEALAQTLLLSVLNYLEKLNLIVFESNGTAADEEHVASTIEQDGVSSASSKPPLSPPPPLKKSNTVGGLKVTMNTPSQRVSEETKPATKRWLAKDPSIIEWLQSQGNSDQAIEDILLSEERRGASRDQNSGSGRQSEQGSSAGAASSKRKRTVGLLDHLRGLNE